MYASKSTNAFHIILHNFIYFKTTRQRPYSLNLILKSKPNILSAKHYYFSFLNKCYCCWLCFCPKSSRRHTWFFRVQINCYKTSKQSSFNFNLQCKSSFIQCSKVHIIPILKVHLSVKVSVFLYPWIDDVRTLLRVWGGVRDRIWICRLHEVVTLTWWNLEFAILARKLSMQLQHAVTLTHIIMRNWD